MVASGTNAGAITEGNEEIALEVEALIKQGKALAKEQQFDEALRVLEQAVRLAPECEQAVGAYRKTVSQYTRKFEQNGQYQYVCDVFNDALTLLPDSYLLLNDYGCSSANFGDFNKASQLFKRSITINDLHVPRVHFTLEMSRYTQEG